MNKPTYHPSFGFLSEEEAKRLFNQPLHAFRDEEVERAKIEARDRGQKKRKKHPKTIFMFKEE